MQTAARHAFVAIAVITLTAILLRLAIPPAIRNNPINKALIDGMRFGYRCAERGDTIGQCDMRLRSYIDGRQY